MSQQQTIDYTRIAEAIEYIKNNFKAQPNLEQVAEKVNLSPFHFQRLFKDWAGVSPKKFLQYTSLQYAKDLLKNSQITLSEATHQTGLSSSGRLHDLFVKIEGMTPGEFKNGGENLEINYSFLETIFGNIIAASTQKGICYMAFSDQENASLETLKNLFPKARFVKKFDFIQQNALNFFSFDCANLSKIKLHLKATDFQIKVWETLLKIPQGCLSSYGKIASEIQNQNASRAVGTAIGSNLVAFLIPCHRVIQGSGNIGQYRWGNTRKTAIIGWEAAKLEM